MNLTRRIRTVLYADEPLSSIELDLLHTRTLQRLYDLHQLGLTDRVFIDASHTRLSHAVGVMHQASKLLGAIVTNLRNQPHLLLRCTGETHEYTRADFAAMAERREAALRYMGLLHDLTHAPYGHTLEDEIELVAEKHDSPGRQANAFLRLTIEWFSHLWTERRMRGKTVLLTSIKTFLDDGNAEVSDLLIEEAVVLGKALCDSAADVVKSPKALAADEIREALSDLAFAFRALLHLEAAHKPSLDDEKRPKNDYPVDRLLRRVLDADAHAFVPTRDAYLADIIGNTICADLLDYAKRDAINSGLHLTYDANRIIENFTLVESRWPEVDEDHPFHGTSIRTAVSLFYKKFRPDAIGELIGLLQTRYYVYERMLYHPTKCMAGATLGAALQAIGWQRLPNCVRHMGDAVFLQVVEESARYVLALVSSIAQDQGNDIYTSKHASDLKKRIPEVPLANLVLARLLVDQLVVNSAEAKQQLARLMFVADKTDRSVFQSLLGMTPVPDADGAKELLPNRSDKAALAIKTRVFPTVDTIVRNISAGLELLESLQSRRYPQRVFCLMGERHVVKAAGSTAATFSSKEIAQVFKDKITRRVAETEIETRCQLAPGSVVIHCPNSKGPVKIAQVLITHGDHTNTPVTLEKVSELEGLQSELLKAHQSLIIEQQRMYSSTWRLSVGVMRPYDVNWKTISKVIGEVLCAIVSKGHNHGAFENNVLTELELGGSNAGRTEPIIVDGIAVPHQRAMEVLRKALNTPGIGEFMSAADDEISFAAHSSVNPDLDATSVFNEHLTALFKERGPKNKLTGEPRGLSEDANESHAREKGTSSRASTRSHAPKLPLPES